MKAITHPRHGHLLAILLGLILLVPTGARCEEDETSSSSESFGALSRDVEARLALAEEYRYEEISPMEIQEVKQLLDRSYPDTAEGANLKATVYIELARIYLSQGISPMAIKLLQDGTADLASHVEAEIALREELLYIYRVLGFAPQAIREHRRIRRLRSGS